MQDMETSESFPLLRPRREGAHWYQDVRVLNHDGLHIRPCTLFFRKILAPLAGRMEMALKIHGRPGSETFNPVQGALDIMALGIPHGTLLTFRWTCHTQEDAVADAWEEDIAAQIHDIFYNKFAAAFEPLKASAGTAA